jgi:hypothetical protein
LAFRTCCTATPVVIPWVEARMHRNLKSAQKSASPLSASALWMITLCRISAYPITHAEAYWAVVSQ